jgi:hypothetical protein
MTSTIKVNNVQNQCGQNIINENSNTITIGASGDTIALASGASQTGFGRTGTVDWQTGSIKTGNFTAENGKGYFCNTSGGAFTATLPASPSAGDIVAFADYTRTFNTNNLTIGRNSQPIGGITNDAILSVNGQSATFVYVDGTEGWININETQTSQTGTNPFITATGGTITTSGNCKIHTFTGPGTFQVCNVADCAANNAVAYLVVAGGASGGGAYAGGGGGAGGYREGKTNPITPYTASPKASTTGITVTATSFPITVGGGGSPVPGSGTCQGNDGNNSVFSTITSAGGGGGGGGQNSCRPKNPGRNGGSGGGAMGNCAGSSNPPGGSGNTPPVSPPQGSDGGNASSSGPTYGSGGGGGAASCTGAGGSNTAYGNGGPGTPTQITGSAVSYAGGGGGGTLAPYPAPGGGGSASPCGTGGQGSGGGSPTAAGPSGNGAAGTANRGGGGGGGSASPSALSSGAGGSGIVIIRYKFQ